MEFASLMSDRHRGKSYFANELARVPTERANSVLLMRDEVCVSSDVSYLCPITLYGNFMETRRKNVTKKTR